MLAEKKMRTYGDRSVCNLQSVYRRFTRAFQLNTRKHEPQCLDLTKPYVGQVTDVKTQTLFHSHKSVRGRAFTMNTNRTLSTWTVLQTRENNFQLITIQFCKLQKNLVFRKFENSQVLKTIVIKSCYRFCDLQMSSHFLQKSSHIFIFQKI